MLDFSRSQRRLALLGTLALALPQALPCMGMPDPRWGEVNEKGNWFPYTPAQLSDSLGSDSLTSNTPTCDRTDGVACEE